MRIYPTSTANQNVPRGAFLIAETSAMSGEIITTYYADKEGNLYKVNDWKGSKPSPAMPFEVSRLTLDTPDMIFHRITAHYARL